MNLLWLWNHKVTLLSKIKIKKRLENAPYIYATKSKYIVYIIEANDDEIQLTSKDFGTKEIHDDINRIISWIPLDKFLLPEIVKYKLNWRLKNKILFDKLKDIKNKKTETNLFTSSENNTDDE
jgi:hypothetical protein